MHRRSLSSPWRMGLALQADGRSDHGAVTGEGA